LYLSYGGEDLIAKIAVSAAIYAIDKPYSYRVPTEMQLCPGQRVTVPFGRGNRRTEGIVLWTEADDGGDYKPVDSCLDETPVLDDAMLRLAAFLCRRCFCTFYEAARCMLPAGLWFAVRDTYTLTADPESAKKAAVRNPMAVSVTETLAEAGGSLTYEKLRRHFPEEDALQDALRYLLKKELLTSETDFLRRAGDKTEFLVTLSAEPEEAMDFARRKAKTAPLQAEVMRLMCSIGTACAKEVQYFTGATMATLRRLEEMGMLTFSQREVLHRVTPEMTSPAAPVVLTPEQETAFAGLCAQLGEKNPKPALLYGVTGSGKTSVYIKLISRCLEQGRSALLLVPEIALTPQLLGLVASHFGDRVAVLHSGLRVGERYGEWKRIRSGEARVVVGTRSAVFAPVKDLGLVILDEEQEHTYKSENSPRYHAREVAIFRGSREGALVLLGSATPSVESMYHAKMGEYTLYTLRERYNGRSMPGVELVDLREELKSGNPGQVSGALLGRLTECVDAGRQSILFLNRRGSSRCLVCVDCGEAPQCPRCSVSLTYHSANRRLMCHYCGHSRPVSHRCDLCGGQLKPMGAGTQKVEQELRELLPSAAVERMDADTVTAVNDHRTILNRFAEKNIPILLGTQMVAKGLDFDNVTLVGVLDADLSLFTENFRAAETTFSMLTQVVGRAGRGSREGMALIQTMSPEHRVIRLAAAQDYDSFYDMEIAVRCQRRLPPFAEMTMLHFSGMNEQQVCACAAWFRGWLEQSLQRQGKTDGVTVLGPAPAPVTRINNRYYYRLTVLSGSQNLGDLLRDLMRAFAKEKKTRGVNVYADRNPYE